MQDRQPFTLAAGEHHFQVYVAISAFSPFCHSFYLCDNRQGNIYIMHQMMQYGADLRLTDLQGKTSMHHAVTGGNM